MKLRLLSGDAVADPCHMFTVSLAMQQTGNKIEAEKWRAEAQNGLTKLGKVGAQTASVLNRDHVPTAAEMETLQLSPRAKAIVLAECVVLHPEQ